MAFGTNAVFADLQAFTYPVVDFGYDQAFQAIMDLWEAQNRLTMQQLSLFCGFTTERAMLAAAPDSLTTQELDEFGTPNPQKIVSRQEIGFPLRKYGLGWQATFQAMKVMTGMQLAAFAQAAATADKRRVQQRIRSALYTPTNSLFTDRLADPVQQFQLPVKALANADGFPLPIGPNGEVFNASTHNHYLARAAGSVAQTDYDALILTVMEHHNDGVPMLFINTADVGFVRGFVSTAGAGTFAPNVDVRVVQPTTSLYANQALDITNLYNRALGVYNGVEVWVKPWAIAGYPVCMQVGAGNGSKPLMMREPAGGPSGMYLEWDGTGHALHSKMWAHLFDIAVYGRAQAAVLDTTHTTTYVAPDVSAA